MRPGQPYPATFHSFFLKVDPPGVEPGFPECHSGVFPLDDRPNFKQRSVRELNPIFRLTKAACCRNTYRPLTKMIPDGVEPSSPACRAGVVPFDHGTTSGRSRSRTDKITSLSSWPLFPFAYSAVKWQVQESHLAGEGYEPSLGTGPPASKFVSVAGPGIEPRRPAL